MSKPSDSIPLHSGGEDKPTPNVSALWDLQVAVVEVVSANVPLAVAAIFQGILEGLRRRKEHLYDRGEHGVEKLDRWYRVNRLMTLVEASRDVAKRLEI